MGSGGILAAFGAERSPLDGLSTQNHSVIHERPMCVCVLLSEGLTELNNEDAKSSSPPD